MLKLKLRVKFILFVFKVLIIFSDFLFGVINVKKKVILFFVFCVEKLIFMELVFDVEKL